MSHWHPRRNLERLIRTLVRGPAFSDEQRFREVAVVVTALSDQSHRNNPDKDSRTTHGLLSDILAALPGMARIRRRRDAGRRAFAPAPVVSTPLAAEEPVAPPSDEQSGWPTWRTPR